MIKFRVWEPYYKKMFANNQIIIWDGNVYVNDADKITVDKMTGWSIDDKYLMQSTGRFDKNGKEIFEGDVISVIGELHTVFYDTEKGSFRLNPHDKRWTVDYMSNYAHIDSFEIIGSIYQNPELVKEVPDGEAD